MFSDHILLDLYVVGRRQPIQDDVLLHLPSSLEAAFAITIRIAACRPEYNQPVSGFQKCSWQSRDTRMTMTALQSPLVSQASPALGNRPVGTSGRNINLAKLLIISLSVFERLIARVEACAITVIKSGSRTMYSSTDSSRIWARMTRRMNGGV